MWAGHRALHAAQWIEASSSRSSAIPEEWKTTASVMVLPSPAGNRRPQQSEFRAEALAEHPELHRSTAGGPAHVRMVLNGDNASKCVRATGARRSRAARRPAQIHEEEGRDRVHDRLAH